jgi:hypothetical protein
MPRKFPLGYVAGGDILCVSATVPKEASNPPLPGAVLYAATFVGVWNTVAAPDAAGSQFCPSLEYTSPLPLLPIPRPPATNWTPLPPTTARLYCEFVATLLTCVENAAALSV